MIYSFFGLQLDVAARELRSASGTVHMQQQVFDVLCHLVENRGRVVSKTELFDAVWGDRFVSESALTSRVKSAMQAIGDSWPHTRRSLRSVGEPELRAPTTGRDVRRLCERG